MFDLRDLTLAPGSCYYVAALDLSVMGLAEQAGEELIRLDTVGQCQFLYFAGRIVRI